MSKLHVSGQTDVGVLPQLRPLESIPADKPASGNETGCGLQTPAVVPGAGVQQGRGEIRADHLPSVRHSVASNGHRRGSDPVISLEAPAGSETPAVRITPALVPVLDRRGNPLMPCHPARARQLLRKGRAVIAHVSPFVIRLKDRLTEDSEVDGVQVGIDPGSKHTGISVFGFGNTTGDARKGLFAVQLDHRGSQISKNLTGRAALRRGRRSRNLRYRAPRFLNRSKPKGWLAPSLRHRVEGMMSWATKLQRWFPVTGWHQELVRFDMQQLENPEISGVEYQQGTLAGFEVREYLLAKWNRQCAYCDASGTGPTGVPLNIDHINPRANGGSNRVTNLALACIPCNQRKGAQDVRSFLAGDPVRLAGVLVQAKRPLRDAAAVNGTRRALQQALAGTGLPVATGSGALTKFNRTTNGLPKSHTLDALSVGTVTGIAAYPEQVHVAKSTGRGKYQRTGVNKYGFPTRTFTSAKTHFGFATGDLARAVIPRGIKTGTYTGRVAVRATGRFNITTDGGVIQGLNHKHFQLIQRADGWQHSSTTEETLPGVRSPGSGRASTHGDERGVTHR
jgi:5-methylcytosine-specific restriction endonuclease McrA